MTETTTSATNPPDVDSAVKKATDGLEQRILKNIGKALTGEKEKAPIDPLHQTFAEAPQKFVRAIVDATTENVLDAVNEQGALSRGITKASNEYPMIRKMPNEILVEIKKIRESDPNTPLDEIAEKAAQNLYGRMGWKKQSDQEKDREVEQSQTAPKGRHIYENTTGDPKRQGGVDKLNVSANDYFAKRRAAFATASNPNAKK